MANFADADDAIRRHIRDGWNACPLHEGLGPETEPDPPAPFAKLFVSGAKGEIAALSGGGGIPVRRFVRARLVAFVPVAQGEAVANRLASAAVDLLSVARITITGAETVNMDAADIGEPVPADDAGTWLSVTTEARGYFYAVEGV